MKINGYEVKVFYDGTRMDAWTVVVMNSGDVWGCSTLPEGPNGYAGKVDDVKGYIKEAKSSRKKIGFEVTNPKQVPDDIVNYIKQIVKL